MSDFFNKPDELSNKPREFIAPDYSSTDEDKDSDEDSITYIDEAKEDEIIDKKEDGKMVTTPFNSTPQANTTPTWGTANTNTNNSTPYTPPAWGTGGSNMGGGSTSFWNQPQQKPTWGTGQSTTPTWGASQSTTNINGKVEIDRTKKVIITDFLDIIAETYQSNGQPGLTPRGIYDLKPRFEVWSKLAAFNPEKIYILSPLLPGPAMATEEWNYTYGYFCQCLSTFLRLQSFACQVVMQSYGMSKSQLMSYLVNSTGKRNEEAVYIGLNSGNYGQSNQDKMSAMNCGIDYVDLSQLLNNMY